VQSELLRQGTVLFSANVADSACARTLAAAEATAITAKIGIWSGPTAIKNAESPGDILAGIGRFTVVEGKVLSVRQAGATTYLNFGRNWTQDFAATISRRMMPGFEAAGFRLSPSKIEGFVSAALSRRGEDHGSKCSGWGRLKCWAGNNSFDHTSGLT
jgi:hypothetical protein